jgi:hypothetical protein
MSHSPPHTLSAASSPCLNRACPHCRPVKVDKCVISICCANKRRKDEVGPRSNEKYALTMVSTADGVLTESAYSSQAIHRTTRNCRDVRIRIPNDAQAVLLATQFDSIKPLRPFDIGKAAGDVEEVVGSARRSHSSQRTARVGFSDMMRSEKSVMRYTGSSRMRQVSEFDGFEVEVVCLRPLSPLSQDLDDEAEPLIFAHSDCVPGSPEQSATDQYGA